MPLQDLSGSVIGVTLLKIDGIYDLDVKDARWGADRAVAQHGTGGGWRNAKGLPKVSLTFEVVAVRSQGVNYAALEGFSAELYDKETRKIVVFAGEGFDWNNIGGNSNVASAMTGKTVTCVGTALISI